MRKTSILAVCLALSATAFAQKKELKEAGKAISNEEFSKALTILETTKDAALADVKFAPQYYFLRGKLFLEKAKKNQDVIHSLSEASQAFKEAEKLDKKFASDILKMRQEAVTMASKLASDAYQNKNYKIAAPAFEQVYRFSPQDTTYLFNAAVLAVQNKDYDTALKHYQELKNLGYDGSEVIYSAKNKETGKFENFPNKAQRDLMVKSKNYTSPKQEKTPSRKAEIIKSIALIYLEQGKQQEAIQAFEDARKAYPKDANLVIQQAYIYYQMNDNDKFKDLMLEASELEPNNPDIQYNIGVVNLQQKQYDTAKKYFEKALALRPDYASAAVNLSTLYINQGNALVEQMNNLGNTKADIKKYDELKAQKDALFMEGAKVLENYTQAQGKNNEVLEQLQNIYKALGDSKNFKRIKEMLQ